MSKKQQRLYAIILVLTGVALATGLALYSLRQNVTFFYSPSEIKGEHAQFVAPDRPFRLGGMVMFGTVERQGKLTKFTVTDNIEDIPVHYEGIVPDLFKEGTGVVATGKLDADGTFIATQLLAKHDENYMPPEVARAMKRQHEKATASEKTVAPEEKTAN